MDKRELERRVAENVTRLPPIPSNVGRIIDSLGSGLKVAELESMISEDPGLCFELLHLANSCYGANHRIGTLEEALELVGANALAQMIAASFVKDAVKGRFSGLEYLDEYFEHSRQVSRGCRILADLTGRSRHEQEMFHVAGLIHDVGRLVIAISADQRHSHLMGTSWQNMADVIHEEERLLGMNHCEVGFDLCSKWEFSSMLSEGVLRHHTPLVQDDFSDPGAVIFVAHFVAMSDFTGEIIASMLPAPLLEGLGLDVETLNRAQALYSG
jgi:HD-like signal output (HDOD) protein